MSREVESIVKWASIASTGIEGIIKVITLMAKRDAGEITVAESNIELAKLEVDLKLAEAYESSLFKKNQAPDT